MGIVILITLLYIIVMKYLGYCVTTFIYIMILLYKLKMRKPVRMVIYSVIITALLYGIFELWLHVHFPKGILF